VETQAVASILVTGASTGIGRHITEYLAARGHTVHATARKAADLDTLAAIERVHPLPCDVTRPAEVRAAVDSIRRAGHGLHGLVNNAGIGSIGFLHTVTDEDLWEVLDVNTLGPHRVVNACLDLLMASRGRVVNIGSMGGLTAMKFFGPYCMSKFALEAYTIALRGELEPHGVQVSIVDPGGIVSEIGVNSEAGVRARLGRLRPEFREEADEILAQLEHRAEFDQSRPESATNRRASSPEIVSAAVHDALFSEDPKSCYLVGTQWEGERVLHTLIERLLEVNEAPQHRYSRDRLIELLDQHLEEREQRYSR
jgi:NAD(P)-dependent dehydrogenase (short-subunit alcohol dehydrogenase family)